MKNQRKVKRIIVSKEQQDKMAEYYNMKMYVIEHTIFTKEEKESLDNLSYEEMKKLYEETSEFELQDVWDNLDYGFHSGY